MGLAAADLVHLFKEELRLCNVKPGETVLCFTDPQFLHPEYVGATIAGATDLGADAFALTAPSGMGISSKLAVASWKTADMVVAATTESWLYTDAHNEALASGTRTLMVHEPISSLRRLFPDESVIKRTYAGARRIAAASEIRVTDEAGSDFTMRKDGRKGHAQVGLADRPSRWDHWPSGLVTCAPIEDSAEGTYVIQPGDVLLSLRRHCTTAIRMTLREGLITKIEGGYDAMLLRDRLESFSDPEAYRLAHAGWGTEHRADWSNIGMDSESFYGSVTVSIGRNMFDAQDEFSGLGGTNYTMAHFDICCRDKRFYLDGELVVDCGKIVPSDLQ
jgi:2,5-dihydroxypyridine 5,6-dioxygenase